MNLKSDDLYSPCEKCKGWGKEYEGKPASGLLTTNISEVECEDCNGKGIKLTDAGKVLEAFIIKILQKN